MAEASKKTEIDLMAIDPSRETGTPKAGAGRPGEGGKAEKKSPSLVKRFSAMIYLLAGMLIVSGGLTVALFLGWISISTRAGQGFPPAGTAAKPPEKPREMGPTVKLPSLVINLKESTGSHFIKTSMVVELEKAEYQAEIQTRTAPLTDVAILTLGDQKLDDLRDPDYKDKLKKDLAARMNHRLGFLKIKQVYFDEFIYQ